MACFLVPMAFGIMTTAFGKKASAKLHMNWLNMLLWGGVIGLALEHVAHKEIIFTPPFLTAASSWSDATVMFKEMATIGTAMLVGIVAVWAVMVIVYNRFIDPSRAKNLA
ncbi:MAG: hypothetical protein MUC62_09245 [Candidatus Thermoplasmatota archaeon]|nr:hypothetical protein [Candidatus Thermoplasmatota archaeon]